jgi:hypothetical protein
MRARLLGAAVLLAFAPALYALDDKDKPKADPPAAAAEEVKKAIGDFQKAQQDFYKENQEALKEAKTDDERQKIFNKAPKADKTVAQLVELAEANPTDAAVCLHALPFVLNYSGSNPEGKKNRDRAIDVLSKHYAANEKLDGGLLMTFGSTPSEKGDALLREVAEKNPKKENQGKAVYCLGLSLMSQAEKLAKDKPDEAAKLTKEAEATFERAADKYGDVVLFRKRTVADAAKGSLFEIRHLQVGMAVPEIEADDLDGKPLKLSDYRGKVVLLDFWGNW